MFHVDVKHLLVHAAENAASECAAQVKEADEPVVFEEATGQIEGDQRTDKRIRIPVRLMREREKKKTE
jgi:hypothetical protein